MLSAMMTAANNHWRLENGAVLALACILSNGEGADEGVDISFADDGHVLLHAAQQCNGQAHRMDCRFCQTGGYDADLICGTGRLAPKPARHNRRARMSAVLGS